MSRPRRILATLTMAFIMVAILAPAAALAQESDSGGKDPGESASAWHAGGLLFWTLIVLGVAAILILVLVLGARGGSSRSPRRAGAPADGRPQARVVEQVDAVAGWELAVLAFERLTGAEHAYADVRRRVAGDPAWLHDLAFAEVHPHGRALLRGTFAGRYLDVHDLRDAPASAAILDAVRAGISEGGSGLVAFAPGPQIDTLVASFDDRASALHRHAASAEEASSLAACVADSPRATAPGAH